MKPIVMIDAAFIHEYDKLVQIFIDDFDGGYQIGKYFISIGHKNVAMIDDNDEEATRHRWRGFKQAYLDSGLKIDEDSHIIINVNEERLADGFNRTYFEFKDKTAIFCVSDFVALKLIKFLKKKGKNVPDDISVAGYDDILFFVKKGGISKGIWKGPQNNDILEDPGNEQGGVKMTSSINNSNSREQSPHSSIIKKGATPNPETPGFIPNFTLHLHSTFFNV